MSVDELISYAKNSVIDISELNKRLDEFELSCEVETNLKSPDNEFLERTYNL